MLERPPSHVARRRRYRQRQRDGRAVAPVEFDAAVLDWSVKLHWLTEAEASDRDAVTTSVQAWRRPHE